MNDKKLFKGRRNKDIKRFSFPIKVINRWDQEKVDAPSLNALKGRQKKHKKIGMSNYNFERQKKQTHHGTSNA